MSYAVRKLFALLLACTMLLCVGCGPANNAGTSNNTSSGNNSSSGDSGSDKGDSIVVATANEPQNFVTFGDVASSDHDQLVLYNIYDTLLYKDTVDGSVKPWLVESWEVSEDGLQYKLKLREDVYFHNGNKLTADDVQFTFDNAKVCSIGSSLLINYDYTEVVDDYNLIIHMVDPYNAFPNVLCSRVACIMDKEYYEEVGHDAYAANPIGTGAYKFVSRSSGDSIVLEANEDYWGGAPFYKTVTIKPITDTNSQILALESGDIDVLLNAPVESLSRITADNVAWDGVGSNATMYLLFNMTSSSWITDDLNFRKAVQYAIDKDAINTVVFSDKATVVDTYGAPIFTGRPAAGTYSTYSYDIEQAKAYLEQSSYDGREFEIACVSGSTNETAAEIIQGLLINIGINAKVNAVDNATFYDIIRETGEFDAYVKTDVSSTLDMDALCNYFMYEKYYFEDTQYTHGAELDSLIRESRKEPDSEKRTAIFAEMCDIINQDAEMLYILVDVNTAAYNTSVEGVVPSMAKYYRYSEWS